MRPLNKSDPLQSCQPSHPNVLDQNTHPFSLSVKADALPPISPFHILFRSLLFDTSDENFRQLPRRADTARPRRPDRRRHLVHQSIRERLLAFPELGILRVVDEGGADVVDAEGRVLGNERE